MAVARTKADEKIIISICMLGCLFLRDRPALPNAAREPRRLLHVLTSVL